MKLWCYMTLCESAFVIDLPDFSYGFPFANDEQECVDTVPFICRPNTCMFFSNYCRKTCDSCNPQQNAAHSWMDELVSNLNNTMQQIIGSNLFMGSLQYQKPSKGQEKYKLTSCPPRSGPLPRNYLGTLTTSASGRICQNWTSQYPHHHDKTPDVFPDKKIGDHNYCRNPDDDINGSWCFTKDPNLRWEYCENTDFACNECMFDNGGCKKEYQCEDTNELKEDTVVCTPPEETKPTPMPITTLMPTTLPMSTTTLLSAYTTEQPTTEYSTAFDFFLDQRVLLDQTLESCGLPKVTSKRQLKIVNGKESIWGQHPWMLAVGYKKKITCGGTIISQKFGLTAAHCIGGNYTDNSVYAGVFNIMDLTKKDEDLSAAAKERIFRSNLRRYFVPHEYDPKKSDEHDIAVLEFDKALEYTDYIQPACLPATRPRKDQWCEVAGWGATTTVSSFKNTFEMISDAFPTDVFQNMFNGRKRRDTVESLAKDRSQSILTASLQVVPQEKCHKTYKKIFTNNMFCAESDNGADTCQGDSGGPFICENEDGVWTVSGITSWGRGCALDGYPGVYTSVVKYLEWISDVQNDKVQSFKKPHLQDKVSDGQGIEFVEIPMFSFFGRN